MTDFFADAAQSEQEFQKLFGAHDPQFESWHYATLATIRSRYTHDQIMSGRNEDLIPQGQDFGDIVADAGRSLAMVIKAAAPFIAMIPGIGLGVSLAITAGSALAAGDRIDYITVDTIEAAIPTQYKPSFRQAVDIGYGLARGQRVDKIAVDLGRKEALQTGGPTAAAAFDAGIAVGTGQGIQDAGFALMGAWVKNADTPVARAAQFAIDVQHAAAEGVSVKDFLLGQIRNEFFKAVPAAQQAYVLKQAIEFFLAHPEELVNPQLADLAERLGIPIEAIRAAIACLIKLEDGTWLVDDDVEHGFLPMQSDATNNESVLQAASSQDAPGTATRNAMLANQGYAIAMAKGNTSIAAARADTTKSGAWRRGFDIGTAVTQGSSIEGSGQTTVRDSLNQQDSQQGFNAARNIQYAITRKTAAISTVAAGANTMAVDPGYKSLGRLVDQTENNQLAAQGAQMAAQNPQIAAARALNSDGSYRRGFDIGLAISMGSIIPGGGQDRVRLSLGQLQGGSQLQQAGFDVGQALAHGITKQKIAAQALSVLSGNPQVAAGQLVTNGMAGSSTSSDQKAAVMATVASDPTARQGAQTAIAQIAANQTSLWDKFWAFFGL